MVLSDHFERVLIPVDFAQASDTEEDVVQIDNQPIAFASASVRSVQLGAAIGRSSTGRLLLVHATPPMQLGTVYTGPITVPPAVVEEIHARAKDTSLQALDVLRARYCHDLEVDFAVRPGTAINVILEEAHRFGADLIVMAASGHSRVTRFFLGSTADRVIRQANCPVLVIPAHPHDEA